VIGGHLDVGLERPDQGDQQAAAGRGQGGCHLPEQGQRMGAAVQQVEGADHVVGALVPRFHRLHAVGIEQTKKSMNNFIQNIRYIVMTLKLDVRKHERGKAKRMAACRSGMQLRCSSRLFVIKISAETAGRCVCVALFAGQKYEYS
jgi:hypothetical protein